VLTPEAQEKIAADIKANVDDATDYAEGEPDPDPSTAMRHVFAEDWPGETPPPWGFGAAGAGKGEGH
jgi:TPP-dependent pyruvate/acetoin dehydrogenase alpha subunit